MPFVANTPESLLARSDSKDPGSTCRGITSAGRPCRRAITKPPGLVPRGRSRTPDLSDESLYCWQHKEQASHSARSSPGPKGTWQPIREGRSSLDTLADRLGLVNLKEKHQSSSTPRPSYNQPPKRRNSRPQKTKKSSSQLEFCFCFTIPIDEKPEPPRPRRPMQQIQTYGTAPIPVNKHSHRPSTGHHRLPDADASPSKGSFRSGKSNTSQTAHFKNFIPDSLDASTASTLMAELAKPHSDSEEPGFIYMFWLTPESQAAQAPVEAARSFLSPSNSRPSTSRRPSDAVSRFASQATPGDASRKKMLLKIGRAANVQRRMNQWQQQCGYDVEVLRYYPQLNASASSPGLPMAAAPMPTPHCKRVERLVHIELAGLGLRSNRGACESCQREHREWFEVEATREGVRQVDDVIRRWVRWDSLA